MNKIISILSLCLIIVAGFLSVQGAFFSEIYDGNIKDLIPQFIGQDIVTLFLVIPIFVASAIFHSKKNIWKLITGGLFGYMLYTYATFSFSLIFNKYFLLYVLAFGLSLYGFIYTINDLLKSNYSTSKKALKVGGTVSILYALLGVWLWTPKIIECMQGNYENVDIYMQSGGHMVIQIVDYAAVLPMLFIVGIMALKNDKKSGMWLVVVLVKMITLGAAILAMAIKLLETDNPQTTYFLIFGTMTAIFTGILISVLKNTSQKI